MKDHAVEGANGGIGIARGADGGIGVVHGSGGGCGVDGSCNLDGASEVTKNHAVTCANGGIGSWCGLWYWRRSW